MPILVSRFQKRHGTLAFLESGMLRSWNQPSHRAALPAESDKSPYSASLNNAEETLPPGPLARLPHYGARNRLKIRVRSIFQSLCGWLRSQVFTGRMISVGTPSASYRTL